MIVGGDDIIPLAPVAQHTSQFTEASHAADLRLDAHRRPASRCPAATGGVDPCATPLSAAAAASEILTDDPYGLAQAYESLGGYLYVPTVALGRLVDSPDQILAHDRPLRRRRRAARGDSTLTGGYGAWSELPAEVSGALAWRSSVEPTSAARRRRATGASDLEARLFPDAGDERRAWSRSTRTPTRRACSRASGAEAGSFSDADLFIAAGHEGARSWRARSSSGSAATPATTCRRAYYGDVTDWVDVFSDGGRLRRQHRLRPREQRHDRPRRAPARALRRLDRRLGRRRAPVSSAGALTYAKQSYLGGLGLYSGYDEKALMEAVYYGLPMYTFDGRRTKAAPLPDTPDLTVATADGLTSAGLSFTPTFETQTATDADGQTVEYLTAERPGTRGRRPASPCSPAS